MLLGIRRTGLDPERVAECARFERERSLPMFRRQPGCRGVLLVRTADGAGAAASTFWDDQATVDRLAASPTYQATVARPLATGLLTGTRSVEGLEVAAGALDALPGVERLGPA